MEKIKSEILKPSVNSFRFINLKPGGNDTCLVQGIIDDVKTRKLINDKIMKTYPNIEQVGFVNLDPESPELMMAGGEFCGNATRSTVYLALRGKPGEVMIKVSGVKDRLKAGVKPNGEAYAQMPIYREPGLIASNMSQDRYLIPLEGITQYVNFNIEEIKGLSEEKIKTKAMQTINKLGLNNLPAAGVIYAEQDEKGWKIKPVVWVRDADTLFLETACASGTAALGQVIALKSGRSVLDLPVKQPSGMSMNVSVDYDNQRFGNAQISGPIEFLNSGLFQEGKNREYLIERISGPKQLESFIKNDSLFQLYQGIFSKAPYFEQFTPEEVNGFFMEYASKGILFLAEDQKNERLIGFGAVLPLRMVTDVAQIAKKKGFDVEKTWYMADLGVDEDYRREGIGKTLVLERLRSLPEVSSVLMRTSKDNWNSRSLYKSLGFERVRLMTQWVEQKRTNGEIVRDPRIFMFLQGKELRKRYG